MFTLALVYAVGNYIITAVGLHQESREYNEGTRNTIVVVYSASLVLIDPLVAAPLGSSVIQHETNDLEP